MNNNYYNEFPNQPYYEQYPQYEPAPPPQHQMYQPIQDVPKIPKLQTINASKLMDTEYPPLAFNINQILPQGIFILAGSGKTGKSWLSLDMCLSVATGNKFWDFNATKGDVLYLALEDTHQRLQGRLERIQDDNTNIENLHLAISSQGITDGLVEQVKDFIKENPNTRFVIIDTLERIRNGEQDKSMYSCDYRDMNKLREILDGNSISLLLVHHTRKMFDPDPLNTLSGSTGLVGAVDGVWVLEKEKRTEGKGKLTIVNRDTEGFCFKVEFLKDECKWLFLGNAEEVDENEDIEFCNLINKFVTNKFSGTATQLVDELKKIDLNFNLSYKSITKKINNVQTILQDNYGIKYVKERSGQARTITLFR